MNSDAAQSAWAAAAKALEIDWSQLAYLSAWTPATEVTLRAAYEQASVVGDTQWSLIFRRELSNKIFERIH